MSKHSVYSALDASELAEDRRAISEKLRRHQMQRTTSSLRRGGYDDPAPSMLNNQDDDSAMDASDLAEDRRAISEKLRRNQMQRNNSERLRGGFDDAPRSMMNHQDDDSAMDASALAHDRRAISEKIRKHQMQRSSSLRRGGYEDTLPPSMLNQDEESAYPQAQANFQSQQPDDILEYDDDVNESLDVMQSALRKDGDPPMKSHTSNRPDKSTRVDSRMRRHTSTRSPIVDMGHFNIPKVGIEIPTTQSREKNLAGFLYILLCIALLVSYAFFLESCKLMNYGT